MHKLLLEAEQHQGQAAVTELSCYLSFQPSVLFLSVFTVLIHAAFSSVQDVGGQEGQFKLSNSVKIQQKWLPALMLFLLFLMVASSSHYSDHISR